MITYNIDLNGKVVLVTGAAGFIGANLVKRLLNEFDGVKVVGIDSITDYYDVRLKHERLEELATCGDRFIFIKGNIADKSAIDNLFAKYKTAINLKESEFALLRMEVDDKIELDFDIPLAKQIPTQIKMLKARGKKLKFSVFIKLNGAH